MRKKRQQDYTEKLLNVTEEEKRRISENLHDGLGQKLLILKNDLSRGRTENSAENLNEILGDLGSITKELHPVALTQLGLSKALNRLVERVDDSSLTYFSIEIESLCKLTQEQELHVYQIVQEAISNVVKHSNALACRIPFYCKNDVQFINIRDNGRNPVGQPESLEGLGMNTIRNRVNILGGQCSFEIGNKGFGIKINFAT